MSIEIERVYEGFPAQCTRINIQISASPDELARVADALKWLAYIDGMRRSRLEGYVPDPDDDSITKAQQFISSLMEENA